MSDIRTALGSVLAIHLLSVPALADGAPAPARETPAPTQDELIERDLEYRLDMLESSTRPARSPRTSDLLTDSKVGASQQELRTLKTRDPNAGGVPLLERQLDRIQRDRAPRNPLLRD